MITKSQRAEIEALGFGVYFKAIRHVRGWPTKSEKPFQLYSGSKFLGSFATFDALLANAARRVAA